MKSSPLIFIFLINLLGAEAQTTLQFAEGLRTEYEMPELTFAVLSCDTIYEMHVTGVQRVATNFQARLTDRFHLGSNTKAITSFLAALLVEEGKIKWQTRFLDLFPELRRQSRKAYYDITLENLLTFRAKLPPYTYTFDKPTRKNISGDPEHQRYLLARYFLSRKPIKEQNGLTPSNADYILAGLMLEKVSGSTFQELVRRFGEKQGIDFGFDYPNLTDTLQPWGHNAELKALAPEENYKLNWLLCAGNINVSLPDYIKFIQLQLKGLKGESDILSKEKFEKLMFGLPIFSFGWFKKIRPESGHLIAYNEGDAGAFVTKVEIDIVANQAFIVFTNASTEKSRQGVSILMNWLQEKYGSK